MTYPSCIKHVEQCNQNNGEDKKEDCETKQTCKDNTVDIWYYIFQPTAIKLYLVIFNNGVQINNTYLKVHI